MCGLTGGWSRQRFGDLQDALPRMTDALVHRGPDDDGHWLDEEAGIGLGHRRLAIVDLSPAGHQPMVSASGRWVIAYNGEIYNHPELREDLEATGKAPAWRGHSDTETLLAAVEAWGVPEALARCAGMFAFALWDRQERALWLARDRFGEKPLYYGWNRGVFLFGSELKALRAFPGFNASVDRRALGLFLSHNAVPAPFSIYQGISKLLPGHWLKLDLATLDRGEVPAPEIYWSASEVARNGIENRFSGSESEATDALERLLRNAVGRQMVADVPLGAFLSGGIDSSVVVAMMQAQSSIPVRTFSIGFDEAKYNEAEHAAAVARHLGTDHTELYVTPEDALSMIPRLPHMYDEPFSDASQVPTALVAQMARQHVTVALSGDGGDELFGGYVRYFFAARMWRGLQHVPLPVRKAVSAGITAIPLGAWDRLHQLASPVIPSHRRLSLPGDKVHKGAGVLAASSARDLYRGLITQWKPGELLGEAMQQPVRFGPPRDGEMPTLAEHMMLEDACHYMPDDNLVKVDRAAMACSLETRVPLIDHNVFEFAWSLPLDYKIKGGKGKHVLRQVLYRHVPEALIERPKMGFGVPIGDWLKGPLKEWAATLLDPGRLRAEGFFNPDPITRKWNEHLAGKRSWTGHLWSVLMFQAWLDTQKRAGFG